MNHIETAKCCPHAQFRNADTTIRPVPSKLADLPETPVSTKETPPSTTPSRWFPLQSRGVPVPHKDFSELYGKMSGEGASASEAHRHRTSSMQGPSAIQSETVRRTRIVPKTLIRHHSTGSRFVRRHDRCHRLSLGGHPT
jgi:hypothetical protein